MRQLDRHPLSWNDAAPVRVERSRQIDAPPSTVWAAIADHANWPKWFEQLKVVTPGNVADAVGGTRTVQIGPITIEEEFLVFEPEQRFAFAVTALPRRFVRAMNEDVRLEAVGESATKVTYVQAIDIAAPKVLGRLLPRGMGKAIEDGLAGLDRYVTG